MAPVMAPKPSLPLACLIFFRSINAASLAPAPEQFAHLTEAIGNVSGQQVQDSFRIGLLENSNKVKTCRDHEEDEGRINTDLLNRLIIVGGPLLPPGDNLQEQLLRQVSKS
jgi:hypothetical protein